MLIIGLGLLLALTYTLAIAENRQKHKPPAGTGPGEKVIAAARKTAEKERKAAEKTKRDAEKTKRDAEKAAITENKLQLLNMDIAHYSKQSAKIERIAAKTDKRIRTIKSTNTADFTVKQKAKIQKELENLEKAQIASDEKLYRIERKIAAAALEMERLQTPE